MTNNFGWREYLKVTHAETTSDVFFLAKAAPTFQL
jgi:hypothetical protein